MTSVKRIDVKAIAYHRNGVFGTGFDVVLFRQGGRHGDRKIAILFPEPGAYAVLGVAKLAAGDIAFGSNSWRGDEYEPHLRNAINSFTKSEA